MYLFQHICVDRCYNKNNIEKRNEHHYTNIEFYYLLDNLTICMCISHIWSRMIVLFFRSHFWSFGVTDRSELRVRTLSDSELHMYTMYPCRVDGSLSVYSNTERTVRPTWDKSSSEPTRSVYSKCFESIFFVDQLYLAVHLKHIIIEIPFHIHGGSWFGCANAFRMRSMVHRNYDM